jgi:hypothetical protein
LLTICSDEVELGYAMLLLAADAPGSALLRACQATPAALR